MTTTKISATIPANSFSESGNQKHLFQKYLDFVDSQSKYEFPYWVISLMVLSIVLPLTFLVVYSLGGPTLPFLSISMLSFFTVVIANMGGASFRFRFNSTVAAIVIHALIILLTLLITL